MNNVTAKVIFDNGGGITVQLHDSATGQNWAHFYNGEEEQAALDVRTALERDGFVDFDGDEAEARDCAPTDEEIRNGCYQVECFETLAELNDFSAHADEGGFNMINFRSAVARHKSA